MTKNFAEMEKGYACCTGEKRDCPHCPYSDNGDVQEECMTVLLRDVYEGKSVFEDVLLRG